MGECGALRLRGLGLTAAGTGYQPFMTDEVIQHHDEEAGSTAHAVARGRSDKTPLAAIGATALTILIVFIIALGLAALAYVLAR